MEISIDATRDTHIEQGSGRVGPGGGPKTEEGKEIARWNATRHGIRSPAPVVPGVEKAEDWEDHRDGVLDNLSPVGHLEFVLAERVALLSWRLHRVIRYETESIALYQERVEDDLAKERRFGSGPDHPEAVRGNAKSDRDDYRLLKRFAKMEEDKRLSSFEADLVIWGAMESRDAFASTLVASKYRSSPRTSPASTHICTICSKKRLKTGRPKRSRVRVRLEWSGRGS
jgi:hypothetical protein